MARRGVANDADEAIARWLRERSRLRACGYPGRPPDIETAALRGWLPRPGEQALPYVAHQPTEAPGRRTDATFQVFTATWFHESGMGTKLIVTGYGDGSFLSRRRGGSLALDHWSRF